MVNIGRGRLLDPRRRFALYAAPPNPRARLLETGRALLTWSLTYGARLEVEIETLERDHRPVVEAEVARRHGGGRKSRAVHAASSRPAPERRASRSASRLFPLLVDRIACCDGRSPVNPMTDPRTAFMNDANSSPARSSSRPIAVVLGASGYMGSNLAPALDADRPRERADVHDRCREPEVRRQPDSRDRRTRCAHVPGDHGHLREVHRQEADRDSRAGAHAEALRLHSFYASKFCGEHETRASREALFRVLQQFGKDGDSGTRRSRCSTWPRSGPPQPLIRVTVMTRSLRTQPAGSDRSGYTRPSAITKSARMRSSGDCGRM